MNTIFSLIENHKIQLSEHAFCRRLRNAKESEIRVFSFVPHMSFFVLGFRDLLEYLRVPFPRNSVDFMLNEHCKEDSDHWLWFLQDLETLNKHAELNTEKGLTEDLRLIWGPENFAVRRQVYDTIIQINQCQNAQEKLIVVECLEAAFAAFIESLNPLTQRMGLYQQLRYFGEHHYQKESEHAMGSWLDTPENTHKPVDTQVLTIRPEVMAQMVDDIFMGFETMFSCWLAGIEKTPVHLDAEPLEA